MSSYRDDYRSGAREVWWTLPRAVGAFVVFFVVIWLLIVVLTPLTVLGGWARGEVQLRSFNHVRQTYAEAFDDAKGLDALAQNSCLTRQARNAAIAAGDTNTANQRETQLLAYEQRYNSLRGEYNAYMDDHFRGGVIHPSQLPLPYPTLAIRMTQVC